MKGNESVPAALAVFVSVFAIVEKFDAVESSTLTLADVAPVPSAVRGTETVAPVCVTEPTETVPSVGGVWPPGL